MKNVVLKSTNHVCKNSANVEINYQKLEEYVSGISFKKINNWLTLSPFDINQLPENDKLNFIFLLNAISFSYRGCPKRGVYYKDKEWDGALGMIASLGRAWEKGIPIFKIGYRKNINSDKLKKILEGNTEIPLLLERTKIIKELANGLQTYFNNDIKTLIYKSKGDCLHLVDLIIKYFPSFGDSSTYNGEQIFFNKRSQLFVADLYHNFKNHKYGKLNNIEHITACADYKLPRLLKKNGILKYSKNLENMINIENELIHNSKEEVEIRSATIRAVEHIKRVLLEKGHLATSNQINDYLRIESQDREKQDSSYHHTRTTAY